MFYGCRSIFTCTEISSAILFLFFLVFRFYNHKLKLQGFKLKMSREVQPGDPEYMSRVARRRLRLQFQVLCFGFKLLSLLIASCF